MLNYYAWTLAERDLQLPRAEEMARQALDSPPTTTTSWTPSPRCSSAGQPRRSHRVGTESPGAGPRERLLHGADRPLRRGVGSPPGIRPRKRTHLNRQGSFGDLPRAADREMIVQGRYRADPATPCGRLRLHVDLRDRAPSRRSSAGMRRRWR